MTRTIILRGKPYSYTLTRKKVKNINMYINPDGSIHVSANNRVSIERIELFLLSKQDTIVKNVERLSANPFNSIPRNPTYNDGDTWYFLGYPFTLKVKQAEGKAQNDVELDGDYLVLTVKQPESESQRISLMEKWAHTKTEIISGIFVERLYPQFADYNIPYPQVKSRKMYGCWGNCRPKSAVITINTALIQHHIECVEFVVAHEMVHLVYPNHSKEFYQLLSKLIPDYKERDKLLINGRYI